MVQSVLLAQNISQKPVSVSLYICLHTRTYVYVCLYINKSEDIRLLFSPALKPVQTLVVMEKWRIQCDSVAAFDFILDRVGWVGAEEDEKGVLQA